MNDVKNKSTIKSQLKRLISYDWMVKNMSLYLFLFVLALAYIANGHAAAEMFKKTTKINKEIKELEYIHRLLKGELLLQKSESKVLEAVQSLGLKENDQLPVKIGK